MELPSVADLIGQFASPVIIGAALTFLLQYTKKQGWSSRFVIAVTAIVVGVIVVVFNTFVSPEVRLNVVNFLSLLIATCWGLYEYFIRIWNEGVPQIRKTK